MSKVKRNIGNAMNETRLHECEFQNKSVATVYASVLGDHAPEWVLMVSRLAEEADLQENHHLENVGDVIWQTVVSINNCPFCGFALSDVASSNIRIQHIDATG